MEKKQNVLILALCSLLFVPLFATEPIDDVYYWPSQETKAVKSAEVKSAEVKSVEVRVKSVEVRVTSEEVRAKSEEAQAVKSEEVKSEEAPATNTIEYVNVQDTTVTIKVK